MISILETLKTLQRNRHLAGIAYATPSKPALHSCQRSHPPYLWPIVNIVNGPRRRAPSQIIPFFDRATRKRIVRSLPASTHLRFLVHRDSTHGFGLISILASSSLLACAFRCILLGNHVQVDQNVAGGNDTNVRTHSPTGSFLRISSQVKVELFLHRSHCYRNSRCASGDHAIVGDGAVVTGEILTRRPAKGAPLQ